MSSYHTKISERAKEIEIDRKKSYTQNDDNWLWTERELHFIHMILGKATRLKLMSKNRQKILDDIIDIYNFTALLYEEVMKE